MKSDISSNFDTAKESAAVFVIYEGRILLKRFKFEGIWCCGATMGKFLENSEDPTQELIKLEKENLGIDLPPKYICTIVSYINKPKPDGRVRLTSLIYLLEISEGIKSKIKKDPKHRWMKVEEVNNSKEIREDDKFIFTRILEQKYNDIVLDVDQMEKWAKAKLIGWKEA